MRLLHTSDWHLGKSLYEFSLLEDQAFFLDDIVRLIQLKSVDAVLLAGDIYDRPLPASAAVQLYDRFLSTVAGRLGVPVIAVAGNHDSASRLEFGSSLTQSSGYYISGHPGREIRPVELRDSHGPVLIWPIPYLHPADIRVLFDDPAIRTYDQAYRLLLDHNRAALDPGLRNIAMAHGFFSALSGDVDKPLVTSDSEINIGGMDIADAACFGPFDYTALGHLHAPQWVLPDRVRYSGTPMKYSLSEERQAKSVTMVDLGPKGEVSWEVVPLANLRDVRVIAGTFEELSDPSGQKEGSFQDYVFAEISGTPVTYPMEKLRVLFPRILGLSFREGELNMPQIAVTRRAKLSVEEQFLRFYRALKDEDMPPEQLEILRDALAELEREADE